MAFTRRLIVADAIENTNTITPTHRLFMRRPALTFAYPYVQGEKNAQMPRIMLHQLRTVEYAGLAKRMMPNKNMKKPTTQLFQALPLSAAP